MKLQPLLSIYPSCMQLLTLLLGLLTLALLVTDITALQVRPVGYAVILTLRPDCAEPVSRYKFVCQP